MKNAFRGLKDKVIDLKIDISPQSIQNWSLDKRRENYALLNYLYKQGKFDIMELYHLLITLGLEGEELGVKAFVFQKLFVSPFFYQAAGVQNNNFISPADGAKPVGNQN